MQVSIEDFIREKIKCCSCGGSLKNSKYINAICLDKLATWDYPVWNNILVEDKYPEKRAVAYVCDECVENGKEPKYAVEWDEERKTVKYHPIDELKDLPPIPPEEVEEAFRRLGES